MEVPTDGSVPRVQPWQLRRRVVPANPDEHDADSSTPVVTDSGVTYPGLKPLINPSIDLSDPSAWQGDSDVDYEIEMVHHAEKVGNDFQVWLKWKDSDQLTYQWWKAWKSTCKELGDGGETYAQAEAAIASALSRWMASRSGVHARGDTAEERYDDFVPEPSHEEPTETSHEEPTETSHHGRPSRKRSTPDRYQFAVTVTHVRDCSAYLQPLGDTTVLLAAALDWVQPCSALRWPAR